MPMSMPVAGARHHQRHGEDRMLHGLGERPGHEDHSSEHRRQRRRGDQEHGARYRRREEGKIVYILHIQKYMGVCICTQPCKAVTSHSHVCPSCALSVCERLWVRKQVNDIFLRLFCVCCFFINFEQNLNNFESNF